MATGIWRASKYGPESTQGLAAAQADETFVTNDNRGLIVDFHILWRLMAADIYAKAYSAYPDFYAFYRLPAYERALGKDGANPAAVQGRRP